jgi:hypothetical protein
MTTGPALRVPIRTPSMEVPRMSKQLILSAGFSVSAMLAFIVAGGPALASETDLAGGPLKLAVNACTPPSMNELLPVIQPGLL